jgi:hypothetical protein
LTSAQPGFVQAWMGMLTGSSSTFNLGALPTLWTLTAPVYMLGGLLFGIATFRSGVLPRWAGVLLAAGTLMAPLAGLLPNASQPKIAVPVGIGGFRRWPQRPVRRPLMVSCNRGSCEDGC